ncbi:MAG: S41 family peptidase [Actinomycetota bacterium]|nr:S41 family peptidase [Actinomycetota bacterium]
MMKPYQKVVLALLGIVSIALASFSLGFGLGGERFGTRAFSGNGGESGLATIRDAYEKIMSTSVDPPDEDALARGAIRGMAKVLKKEDPYAFFYSPSSYQSFKELTTGEFSGIGVWLNADEGKLVVMRVFEGTPAEDAGIQKGDVIRTVAGKPVGKMTIEEAIGGIKGRPGTKVELGIERDGEVLGFTVTRKTIELPNLIGRMQGPSLGYIELFGFAKGAGRQVRAEVERLTDLGARGVVLDMRNNGGGLFSEAIDVASVFIEDGEIVTYRERSEDDLVYRAEGDAFEDLPLVVLVNGGTASASEIVAGALQDTDRAKIVGVTTFGKGSVQQVVPLLDASALKVTTAAYLTPDGRNINGTGIDPDIVVEAGPDPDADPQRDRAIEILRGIAVSATG